MKLNICISVLLLLATANIASAQKKITIEQVEVDVITIEQQLKLLQSTVDANGAAKELVGKLVDQVSAGQQDTDRNFKDLQAQNKDTAAEVHKIAESLTKLVDAMSDLKEDVSSLRANVNAISKQLMAMQTTTQPLPGPDDLWRTAQLDYLTGNYALAIPGFQDFLSKYPGDTRAAEGHLRIADSLFNLKKYDAAEMEFDSILQQYPDKDIQRTALLKKAYSLAEHDKPQALKALNDLVKQYPNTDEATRAQEKIRELAPPAKPRPGKKQ